MVKAMTMLLRKILLDEHTDKVVRNSSLAKRKEEAALAAREEIKAQTLREMALKSEVPHHPHTTMLLTIIIFLILIWNFFSARV